MTLPTLHEIRSRHLTRWELADEVCRDIEHDIEPPLGFAHRLAAESDLHVAQVRLACAWAYPPLGHYLVTGVPAPLAEEVREVLAGLRVPYFERMETGLWCVQLDWSEMVGTTRPGIPDTGKRGIFGVAGEDLNGGDAITFGEDGLLYRVS